MNNSSDYATLFQRTLSHAELERHYSVYTAHVQSQIALRKGHREIRWLKTMLGRLPKLERLGYAAQRSGGMGILDLDGTKGLTPLMRATVMDRRLHADSARAAKQIMAVFTAALATRAKVKTFKANYVPWELFSRAPKQWHVLFGAAEHLVSLQLHSLNFARFRRNLTTLDLDLAGASEKVSRSGLKVIPEGCLNVAGLKRLVLQPMACRETTL